MLSIYQDADKYIEEINQISIQFEDCDVKESSPPGVENYDGNNFETLNAFQDIENSGDYDGMDLWCGNGIGQGGIENPGKP